MAPDPQLAEAAIKAAEAGQPMEVTPEQFGATLEVVLEADRHRQRVEQAVFAGMPLPARAATAAPYRHAKVKARRKLAAQSKRKQR